MTAENSTAPAAAAEGLPPHNKGLLRLVYIMAIVLVLLFLGLIGGIIWKAVNRKPAPPPAAIMENLGVDPAKVRLMDLDGNLLALATDTEVVVIDIAKQKVLLRSAKP